MLTNALICVTSLEKSQEYLIKLIALKSKKNGIPHCSFIKIQYLPF